VRLLQLYYRAIVDALDRFNVNDGWATASHIALSALMAVFPFFILLTALAGFLGTDGIADEVANLMLAIWPKEVAGPIANEMHNVLTTARGDVLTIGVALAIYFASSGIESLRIGLNRAYGIIESRNWILLRLESIGYVLVSAVAMLALGFLIVLAPLLFATTAKYARWVAPLEDAFTFWRYAAATLVLVTALVLVHKWLPAGRRRLIDIMPGIIATIMLWMLSGIAFGRYLADFAYTYVTYYAGLASAMIALVFLYYTSMIFVYGGELNAAILRLREARSSSPAHGQRDEINPQRR
jgi:membrane protein